MTTRDVLINRLACNTTGSRYQEFLHPRFKGKWVDKATGAEIAHDDDPLPKVKPAPTVTMDTVERVLDKMWKPKSGAKSDEQIRLETILDFRDKPEGQWFVDQVNKVLADVHGAMGGREYDEANAIQRALTSNAVFEGNPDGVWPFPVYVGAGGDRNTVGLLVSKDGKFEMFEGNDEATPQTLDLVNELLGVADKTIKVWTSQPAEVIERIRAGDVPKGIFVSPTREHAAGYWGEGRELISFRIPLRMVAQHSEHDWQVRNTARDCLVDRLVMNAIGSKYQEFLHPRLKGKWRTKGGPHQTISPVPKPAPGAQTTSPSGQAAAAAISVKPDAAGGAGEAKNTKTMNTRNALIDALVNRCKDRAGKPEGAVENAGTSDGVKKGWEKRRQFYRGQGADNPRRPHSDAGGFAKREHLHVETEHGTFKSPSWWKGSKRHQRTAEQQVESVEHPSELVEKHGWKSFNCTMRDVIADRKAALNSGTSEGVKKGWEKRRGKEFQHPGTGKMYHFNEETGLWHDRKGEPTRMSGIISHLEKQASNSTMLAQMSPSPMIGSYAEGKRRAKNSGKGSDSVRWAKEFLRKSRAQPGKPKVDSTKWAREALVALKAHKPVTNDHRAEALEAGIQVELEHGPDRALAEKIARDHLREDPEYYTKLKRCGVK